MNLSSVLLCRGLSQIQSKSNIQYLFPLARVLLVSGPGTKTRSAECHDDDNKKIIIVTTVESGEGLKISSHYGADCVCGIDLIHRSTDKCNTRFVAFAFAFKKLQSLLSSDSQSAFSPIPTLLQAR